MTNETIVRPAKRPRQSRKTAPVESVRRELELMKPRLATALPSHLTVDRLLRVVITTLQSSPALLDCDRASLFAAVMTCAHLGLEPDGILGQAWLVPSRGKVQLVPGFRGFIALARNSGLVTSINAQAVHRNDHFDYAYGLNERLEHVPAGGERGEITHFYAYARFKDGGHHFDVMSRSEVDAAYRAGKSENSAWVSGYAEMGKTTVIRRLSGYLPLTVRKAAALADLHEAGKHAALDDLGEIVVDLPEIEASRPAEEMAVPAAEPKPAYIPEIEPEGVELSEEELFALLPPLHLIEILDAVAEREMPEEALESVVGKPLDEVVEAEVPDILRAIAIWEPDLCF
ncbi:MAG TPA: recombinase RecT [Thermoanaerobaculia bacterium]|jgi:recombination protein RecT|nr:recombinase RecT [Thermoanaerobaculia bacterium]